MKYFKTLLIAASTSALVACGGHGFEGEYKFVSSGKNDLIGGFAQLMGGAKSIVIGENFMEIAGTRDTYDEIFVRQSDNKKYLVLSTEHSEELWQIVNSSTLMQDNGFMKITIKKVN